MRIRILSASSHQLQWFFFPVLQIKSLNWNIEVELEGEKGCLNSTMPFLLSSSVAATSSFKALTQCDSPYYTPTISSIFNPYAHRKITHLSIFSSSDPSCPSSSSSSIYSPSRASKQTPTNRSLNNLNSHDLICAINDDGVAKTEVIVSSKVRKRSNSLWRKILVGSKSKKTKSILLLHAITIVYGMLLCAIIICLGFVLTHLLLYVVLNH